MVEYKLSSFFFVNWAGIYNLSAKIKAYYYKYGAFTEYSGIYVHVFHTNNTMECVFKEPTLQMQES